MHNESTNSNASFSLLRLIIIAPFPEIDESLQPNRSLGNRQINSQIQLPFQAGFTQQNWNGMRPGPHMSVNNPHIQPMNPNMQRHFDEFMKSTLSQTQSVVNGLNSSKKTDDDDDNSSSYTADANDSVNNKMSELSIEDRMPPPISMSGKPQITTQLSPPMTFSRNKSDPQIALKPTTPDPMSSSNSPYLSPSPSTFQHSHSNPSLAPHMQEPAMVNFLSPLAAAQQFHTHGDNQSRPPLVPGSGFNFPPSAGGPKFNVIYGNVTKHDNSVHEMNIGSYNTETNTIQNAFNDNSLVKSVGKRWCIFIFFVS